jgi:hypothetical protein
LGLEFVAEVFDTDIVLKIFAPDDWEAFEDESTSRKRRFLGSFSFDVGARCNQERLATDGILKLSTERPRKR